MYLLQLQQKVFQQITTLNDKKSNGIKNISIKFLKMAAECISSMLSILFNKCFQKGILPSKLKVAQVYHHYSKVATFTKLLIIDRYP